MDVFDLFAKLSLDTSEYDKGLLGAKSAASAVGGGIASAVKAGLAAVTATTTAVTGFAAASVKAGADFDSSMSQVYATMGDKAEQMVQYNGQTISSMEALRDFAQEMGRTTAFSATESADALNYMALAGYDAQTSMSMLPNVLNLAAAGAMDLARASDMVTDTQTAFGISLERTSQMVDEMAKAASTGNTSVEQLGDAFLVVGGLAQELNGGMVTLDDGTTQAVDGVQELEIALTGMANAGIKGSEAGTHMRNMLLKLASPTDAGTIALEKMGVAVFDAEGNMRSLADIFGDLNTVLNKDGTAGFKAFYDNIARINPEVIKTQSQTKEFADKFNYFGISVVDAEGNLRDFDEVMKEVQDTMGQGFTQEEKISVISDLFNTRDIASAEALLNAVSQDWDNIGESILNAEGAASKMAETQLDNLAGDMTLFNSALEGAKIAISDVLTPSLREFVQFGTDGLSELTGAFKEGGLSGAMETFGTILADGLNMIIEKVPMFIDAGMQLLGALGKGLLDNSDIIVDSAVDVLLKLVDGITQGLPVLVDGAEKIIIKLADGLSEAFPVLIPQIVQLVLDIAQVFIDNSVALSDAALNLMNALVQGFVAALPIWLETVPQIMTQFIQIISENLPLVTESAIHILTALYQGIIDNMPLLIEAYFEIMNALATTIITSIPTVIESFGQVLSSIAEFWYSNRKKPDEWGADLIKNFVGGIRNRFGDVTAVLKDLGELVASLIGFSEPEIGPLSNFHTFAPDMMELFMKGVNDNAQALQDTVSSAFDFSNTMTGPSIMHTNASNDLYGPSGASSNTSSNRNITVILELDKMEFGRAVYELNNAETQRVGLRLANV